MRQSGKIKLLLFVLTLFVNLIIYFRFVKFPICFTQILGEELATLTDEITIDNTVTQTFIATECNLDNIEIYFSTYNRKNIDNTVIKIVHGDEEITSFALDNSSLLDNSYATVSMNNILLEKNEQYTLLLQSNLTEGGVTAWKDGDGQLVSRINYVNKLTARKFIIINIGFFVINYMLCSLLGILKRN